MSKLLCSDIPLSVGIMEPRAHPLQLNTIEFLWDPDRNASVFIQVEHFLSLSDLSTRLSIINSNISVSLYTGKLHQH